MMGLFYDLDGQMSSEVDPVLGRIAQVPRHPGQVAAACGLDAARQSHRLLGAVVFASNRTDLQWKVERSLPSCRGRLGHWYLRVADYVHCCRLSAEEAVR